ncbi:MarR family transcriptional regulator [Rhizobium sp. RU36D]|uniref:MarR family winged helix-turn-helix transcriptional regulator n=1 Tax=Rhizobium sp. RU36D TaxID=1907415 RepID=UPI0009D8C4A9|nr:MarR family transcriptional regulator [Rhizobium sp. RU36D]SMC68604.1 MarR family transcriptional regulator, transcriptional regulator for hemolysin [Rhizobium sp. RU36D]
MSDEKPCEPRAFGKLLGQAARLWRRVADQRLLPHGLTEATWLPLLHIASSQGPLRQKELAAALSLDGSSIVRLLDNLEQGGLVLRCEEGRDRRAKEIRLTDAGAKTVDSLECIASGITNEALAGLPPEDVAAARRVLQHLCDHFAAELGEAPTLPNGPRVRFEGQGGSAFERTQ